MKTLGLIGGTTWHPTVDDYRMINQMVNARLGGHSSARLLLILGELRRGEAPLRP